MNKKEQKEQIVNNLVKYDGFKNKDAVKLVKEAAVLAKAGD